MRSLPNHKVIVVYRERAGLDDQMISAETSYHLNSAAGSDAGATEFGGHVRGHWGIENKVHWVRDWERREALCDRAVVKGHRLRPVAAGW